MTFETKAKEIGEKLARSDYCLLPTKQAKDLCIKKDVDDFYSSLLALIVENMPPEPKFWKNMSKGLRSFMQGMHAYHKQLKQNLGVENET